MKYLGKHIGKFLGKSLSEIGAGSLPSCVRDLAISWHKNLNTISYIEDGDDTSGDWIEDRIGERNNTVYYGQYLSSGTIDTYRTSGIYDYIDPSTGNLVEDNILDPSGLITIPANGIHSLGMYPRDGIADLLDFDGVDDYVEFSSDPPITGNKVIKFKAIISNIISGGSLLAFDGPSSDFLRVDKGTDGITISKGGGFSKSFDISGLENQILEIEISKSSSSILYLKINDVIYTGTTGPGFSSPVGSRIGVLSPPSLSILKDCLIWDVCVYDDAEELLFKSPGIPDGSVSSNWDDTVGTITATVNGSPSTVEVIISDDGEIAYTNFYPICESAGTVLHDTMENSKHISVSTPVWGTDINGSDYLNQYGYVNKSDSDDKGYDWESNVNNIDVSLDANALVPLAKWDYVDLLDSDGEYILDSEGEQLQVKQNL